MYINISYPMHKELVYNFHYIIIILIKYYLVYLKFINVDGTGFVIVTHIFCLLINKKKRLSRQVLREEFSIM